MAGKTRQVVLPLPDDSFWAKATVTSSGCWVWTAATRGGYGVRRNQSAHRVALASRVPHPVTKWTSRRGGQGGRYWLACHHCDNPPCVNPDHLYWGTAMTNAQDRERRALRNTVKRADKKDTDHA